MLQDLPRRARRRFRVSVTHVVARVPQRGGLDIEAGAAPRRGISTPEHLIESPNSARMALAGSRL
jgi:hypothetical protein